VSIAIINLIAVIINSFSNDDRFDLLGCQNLIIMDCSYFLFTIQISLPNHFKEFRSRASQTLSYYYVGDQCPFIYILT